MNTKVSLKRRQSAIVPVDFPKDLHSRIAQLYAARGVESATDLKSSLAEIHSFQDLKGINAAVLLLADALQQHKRFLIVGDFDADGATSSALAVKFLRQIGATVDYLVPNRFKFGYGLTPEIVMVAADKQPDILITVDNGISSIEGVAAAKARGWQVLVTDHHLPGKQLPAADAIVNSNQAEDEFPSKNLAGVGTIFYVLLALRSHLRDIDWFTDKQISSPNMAQFLDLVALGTVADVVPLDANNRVLVAQGLARIKAGQCSPGILALLAISKRHLPDLSASDLAFAVGPRLNAAGRLDDMSVGVECLLAETQAEADSLAARLNELNKTRQFIEADMKQQALDIVSELKFEGDSLPLGLSLYDERWHQGVIGIVASRIKDATHRPVIAFADAGVDAVNGKPIVKGSARSISGIHMRDTLDRIATQAPDVLQKFGGHAMAAGVSIEKDNLVRFKQMFAEEVAKNLSEEDCQSIIYTDGELSETELNLDFAYLVKQSGPWGQAFPEPVFDGEFSVVSRRIVGENHLKLVLKSDSIQFDAIAFNMTDEDWPEKVEQVKVAYQLDINHFRGATQLQLMVRYIEPLIH